MDYIAAALVAQYEKDFGDNRIKDYEKRLERINGEIRSLVDTLAVCPPFADDPQGSSGVRISNDTPRHYNSNPNAPRYIFVNGLFGIICKR